MVNSYIHKNSVIHRIPFLVKIVALSIAIMIINVYNEIIFSSVGLLFCVVLYFIAKISLIYLWRILKMLFPLFVAIALYNMLFVSWQSALITSCNVLVSIGLANLISLTTPLLNMFNKGTRFYRFLVFCKISPPRIQLAIHIVLRTIPLLFAEFTELKSSMRLRGEAKNSIKLLFPLLLRTVSQSDQLVDALVLRGYEEVL